MRLVSRFTAWVRSKFGRPELEVPTYEDLPREIVEEVVADEPVPEGTEQEIAAPVADQVVYADPRAEFLRALRRQALPLHTQAVLNLLEGRAPNV